MMHLNYNLRKIFIVFVGITDLLPRFLIQQIVQWAQGMPLQNMDFAIKEEQMFYVKIE